MRDGVKVCCCEVDIENEEAVLWNVIIYSKYRGHGYCYFLIRKVINFLKRSGIRSVKLFVNSTNRAAIKCYMKCGFVIIKDRYRKNILVEHTMELMMSIIS